MQVLSPFPEILASLLFVCADQESQDLNAEETWIFFDDVDVQVIVLFLTGSKLLQRRLSVKGVIVAKAPLALQLFVKKTLKNLARGSLAVRGQRRWCSPRKVSHG